MAWKVNMGGAAQGTQDAQADMTCIHYTLDGVEQSAWVEPGTDRWNAVARAIGQRLGCRARADDVPVYDSGTRAWCLFLTLLGRNGVNDVVSVAVRWSRNLRPVRRPFQTAAAVAGD